jgi:hypothetical protein
VSKLWAAALVAIAQFALITSIVIADETDERRLPEPLITPVIALEPRDVDILGFSAQLAEAKKELDKYSSMMSSFDEISIDKQRISKLREALRAVTTQMLIVTYVDGELRRQYDLVRRELDDAKRALNAYRQTSGGIPVVGDGAARGSNLNSSTPTDRIKGVLSESNEKIANLQKTIANIRDRLKTLGGQKGRQLQFIDRQNPFPQSNGANLFPVVQAMVRQILQGDEQPPDEPVTSKPNAENATNINPSEPPSTTAPVENKEGDKIVNILTSEAVELFDLLYELKSLTNDVAYVQSLYDNRKRVDDHRTLENKIDVMIGLASQLSTSGRNIASTLNQKIDSALNQIGSRDYFTLVATGIFGGAVVVVICAFFVLAYRDRENKFFVNPDIGLQFVTLFSIIIAIILFGVLDILQAKELSALLGGLAGYILGRGTLGRKDPDTVTATPRRRPGRPR